MAVLEHCKNKRYYHAKHTFLFKKDKLIPQLAFKWRLVSTYDKLWFLGLLNQFDMWQPSCYAPAVISEKHCEICLCYDRQAEGEWAAATACSVLSRPFVLAEAFFVSMHT